MAQKNLEIKLSEQDMERFWKKVAKAGPDECWLWIAGKSGGYGTFKIGRRDLGAHRVAFALTDRFDPEKLVLHKCDVKLCCNPRHLYAGTYSDNLRDAYGRGLNSLDHRRGEQGPSAKLTQANVDEIRRLYAETNLSQDKIARLFGITQAGISLIVKRKTWVRT